MGVTTKGLLRGESVEALRAAAKAGPRAAYWGRMVQRWREIEAWDRLGEERFVASCGGAHVTWLTPEAALIHRLTGEPDALAYVHRQIDRLADAFLHAPEQWRARHGRTHPYWSEAQVCLAADICKESLDPARHDALGRMVREHFLDARFCGWGTVKRYLAGHNIPLTEQVCAGICALVWGEEAGRDDWRAIVERAIDSSVAFCRQGIDAGGYAYEGTMYGYLPMEVIYLFAELLVRNQMEDLFASVEALRTYPLAIQTLLFPDRVGLAPLGDGGVLNSKTYAFLLLTARRYGRPEDLGLWHAYRGPGRAADPVSNNNPPPQWPAGSEVGPVRADASGHAIFPFLWWDPEAPMAKLEASVRPTTTCSHGTEVATFRTSWGPDAVHMVVSGQGRGHSSLDHSQCDGGHVTLFAHGEYLGIDPGYWNIYEEHHSVVLIDGKGQFARSGDEGIRKHRSGHLTGFSRGEMVDYVRADQAFARNCVWADRHVLFVRLGGDSAYVVLVDNTNPDHQRHAYAWQLQAHPLSEVRITGERTAEVVKARARVDVSVVAPPRDDVPGHPFEMKLWTDFVYGAYVEGEGEALAGASGIGRSFIYTREEARRERADLSFSAFYWPRLVAEQSGPSGMMMSVMSPRRTGESRMAVVDRSGGRTLRADVDCGAFTDTVISALDHGLIRFDDVRGESELAVVRRPKAPGAGPVRVWTLEGRGLRVDGSWVSASR